MSYTILEVELAESLPEVQVPSGSSGIAVLVRRAGRPVGFFMQAAPEGTNVGCDELARHISRECGNQLLEEALREELIPPAPRDVPPSVSVAVCTKDRPALLIRCLASLQPLAAVARRDGGSLEILVVDNVPADERTRQATEELPGVRYVREPRVGLDFARNRALREATGEILAFLDDDAIADRFWLDGLYEAIHENPDAAGITGLVLPYELATPAQILFERRGGFRRGFQKIRFHRTSPHNHLYPCGAGNFGAGANMAFRRDVLLELGGFDEALDTGAPLPGGGDLDIFYRVVRAGYPMAYEPRFLAFHEHRREMAALQRQYWSWGLGFMAFLDKSLRHDFANREPLLQTRRWWFGDQLRRLGKSLAGRDSVPAPMIAAELWGSVAGVGGAYRRSQRRTDRIRRAAHE